MPRRALIVITLLVLALHWLVLHGVPLAWESPRQPGATRAFNTRNIAAAPPTAPVAMAVAEANTPAARVAKPPPASARKKPRPAPPTDTPTDTPTQELQAPPPEGNTPPVTDLAGAADATADANNGASDGPMDAAGANAPGTAADSDNSPVTAAAAPSLPASAASDAAAAPTRSASPPDDTPTTSAGVDISAPGTSAGQGASTAPPPVRLPAPTRLAFDVTGQAKKFNYNARAELLWTHDGSHYEARQEVSLFLLGSRSQKSVGQVTPQGLAPERFSDRTRSEQAAHFDQAKGRVTFSANTPEAAVGPGAQDRLSVFIQLGALLAGDPGRFVPGTQITLTTVSARNADRWTFTVEGPETLELPAGATATLKLQRLPRRDYDQKAELWVAPALGYLPVRIKLTQSNGDFADLRLRSSSAP